MDLFTDTFSNLMFPSLFHWTKIKISFILCLPKHELSDTCLAEDRAAFL